jgi:hypothetical protein
LIQGKIFRYNPEDPPIVDKKAAFLAVPESDILCHITGCWRGLVQYQKTKLTEEIFPETTKLSMYPVAVVPNKLLDMQELLPAEKVVAPVAEQKDVESRRIWNEVTSAITDGRFSDATRLKRQLENEQRTKAAARKVSGEVFESYWFGFDGTNDPILVGPTKNVELFGRSGENGNSARVIGKPFLRQDRAKELPWKV